MQHHTNFKLHSQAKLLGPASLICLTFLLLCLSYPVVNTKTSALTVAPSNLQTNVPSGGSLSIALSQDTTLDITPQANGTFQATNNQLTVSSTHPTGYTLYLHTNDQTNSLVNTDTTKDTQITATKQDVLGANLTRNTWGYSLADNPNSATYDQLTYQPVPLTAHQITRTNLAHSTDQYNLVLGANIDTSLPAGQYANNLTISAIANPIYVTGLLDLVYMQDMTSTVCNNTVAYDGTDIKGQPGGEVSKQLIDSRDGKAYWVSKLADGNCWMTQNLALDLDSNKALTSANTDLNSKESWVPTNTVVSETLIFPSEINRTTDYSWNLGEYVLATPIRNVSCNSASTIDSTNTDPFNSVRPGQTIEQNCSDFVNVSKDDWQPTFDSSSAPEGTWSGTNYNSTTGKMEDYTYTGPLSVDKNNKTYDAHYLIGNFYQWNAAVASSGTNLTSIDAEQDANKLKDAPDSICPKGWKLPTTGRNTVTGLPFNRDDSFYKLLLTYEYPNNTTVTNDPIAYKAWYIDNGDAYTKILDGVLGSGNGIAQQNLTLEPMYLNRGGSVNVWTGSYRAANASGVFWSSTAYPIVSSIHDEVYGFRFNSINNIYPSELTYQIYGNPIRCLAR